MPLYPVALLLTLATLPALGAETGANSTQGDRATAAALYRALPRTSAAETSRYVLSLPSALQEEIWTVHLVQYLQKSPQLSVDQRAVVMEAIGMLAIGVLEDLHSGGTTASEADLAVQQLTVRTKALFTPSAAHAMFMQLGDDESLSASAARRTPMNVGSCNCSTQNDWCDWLTNPWPKCVARGPRDPLSCTPVPGCGWFFQYGCDGSCE